MLYENVSVSENFLTYFWIGQSDVVVVLLFDVHGKHLRSCQDGQLT